MGARTVLLVLVLVLAGGASAPEAEGPDEARSVFEHAFDEETTVAERVHALERIVKESPDSKWADDALWALGELARQEGQARRVAYYWQYLMAVHPEPRLEEFTRSLPLHRQSGLAQVEFLLRLTGQSYVRDDGRLERDDNDKVFVNVKPFSPVPMLVWAGLGHSYEQLDKLEMSLKAYQEALRRAPAAGQWREAYADSARRVQAKLTALGAPQAEPGAPAPQTPLPGGDAAAPSPQTRSAAPPSLRHEQPEDAPGD